jgi:hypothetical protein
VSEVSAVSGGGSARPWFGSEWVGRLMEGGADKGRWCRDGW